MIVPPITGSIEIHVPDAESEQTFLLLAVQAAMKTYREKHNQARIPHAEPEGVMPAACEQHRPDIL